MTALSPQTVTTCKPWCNDHHLIDPNIGGPDPDGGWCRHVEGNLVVEEAHGGRLVLMTDYQQPGPVDLPELDLADAARFAADLARAVGNVLATLSPVRNAA